MAKKPETVFRERIDKILKSIPNSWWESVDQKSIVGSPDKIGCVNGHFVALEFKASEKAKRGELQIHKAKKIKQAGGLHYFVYPENFKEVLADIMLLCQEPPNALAH